MNDIPTGALFAALFFLLLLSAFFSGSETALMTLNRYRLRHLAEEGNTTARMAERLLRQPDRLIGLILLGNNFVNILASSLATIIALRLGGEGAIAAAAFLLTLVVLVFAEVAPKTLAALHPERLAFPASWIYTPLLHPWSPLRWIVWVVNAIANNLLKVLKLYPEDIEGDALSREELRTVVTEAGAMIPQKHKKMLLNILDLEKATVEDIMIPRNEIDGVDITAPLDEIVQDLKQSPYTRILAFEGSIDKVRGFIHARRLLQMVLDHELSRERLDELIRDPYYIPAGTALNRQLLQFQRQKRRLGLVVDEYGDVQGMVTLGDLLEEIVGEFTTDPSDSIADVRAQEDGSYLVDGGATVRDLVRTLRWDLPTDGPKTLNGLIMEQLESMPETGISLLLNGYPVEILQTQANAVKTARIRPAERRPAESP